MTILNELKVAYAAATPGEWSHKEGLSEDDYYVARLGDFDFVDTDCSEWPDGDGAVLDAHLIALMHNNLPALIECAEVLEHIVDDHNNGRGYTNIDDELAVTALAALAKLTALERQALGIRED